MVKCLDSELDAIFGALADRNRRSIVLSLREGESTVEELGRPLGITTAGTMKHLGILERSGLVVTEKRGRQRYCRLQAQSLLSAEEWMTEVREFWAISLTRLADHLEGEDER
jgi:DNA-binding transcriptional ArsR family regulator